MLQTQIETIESEASPVKQSMKSTAIKQLKENRMNKFAKDEHIAKIKKIRRNSQKERKIDLLSKAIRLPQSHVDPIKSLIYIPYMDDERSHSNPRSRCRTLINSSNLQKQSHTQLQTIQQQKYGDQKSVKAIPSSLEIKKRMQIKYQFNSERRKAVFNKKNYHPPLTQNDRFIINDFNPHEDQHKTRTKISLPKIKNQSFRKRKKEFQQIDILTLQTSYFKMLKIKTPRTQNNEIVAKKNKIYLPEKDKTLEYIKAYQPKNKNINVDDIIKRQHFLVCYEPCKFFYFGDIVHNEREGLGVQVTSNYIFEGKWHRNQRVQGVQITVDGYFKGKFLKNERGKVGQYFWNNGQYYSGEWRHNKKHGTGMWKSIKGDTYIGNWIDGKVEGFGVHISSTGQKYEGLFKNFLKQGTGKEYFPSGDSYQGQFKNGKPHGKGKYIWKSEIQYFGDFFEGLRTGEGKIIAPYNLKYAGKFLKQKAHGQGRISYINGDQYVGELKNGMKDGEGILKLVEKKQIFKGRWKENEFKETIC